jgi:Tfp pilus assembly protein PilN
MRAVNLIPSDQRGGSAVGLGRSGGAAYAVLALCAGVALMALLYGMADHQVSSRRAQVELSTKAQRAQSAAAQLASYTSFVALRTQRTQAVAQLVDTRFDWAHAFHELGRVLPADASVSALSGTVGATTASGAVAPAAAGGSTVASATPAGSVPSFTVGGCATSQAAVAETINRLRLIDGVSEVSLQSSTKGGSGGSSAGAAGGCPASSPAFNVIVTFQPLPAASSAGAVSTVAAASEASASAGKSAGTVR